MSDTDYFELAAEQARHATCTRARCGSVIVAKDGMVIGQGYNAPALDDEAQRMCDRPFDRSIKPNYDLTCCVHAEWNAIIDALKNHGAAIDGSTLYFMRVNEQGERTDAGKPFCTVCSRLALQAGVTSFALWADGDAQLIDTAAYNLRSYDFHRPASMR